MDSVPARYSPTGYGTHDGEAVVQTPHAVKTLQGEHVEAILELLSAMDGEIAASELVDRIPDATAEYIELLYENRLAYDCRAIPAGLADRGDGRLLEAVLPSIAPQHHHELPDRLASLSVAVFGDHEVVEPVISRLRAAGVSVDSATEEPDLIVLSELLERSGSWSEANEQWVGSESTLVRTRLTERGWRLGPVFTPDAPVCLNCLYSRVDANKAGGQLFTETVAGDPPHIRAYVDALTELLFGALLGVVPRQFDEQFVVSDQYDHERRTPRVFGLPHCEVCNV